MRRGGRRNGQTLGKQLLGIRVVREDGRPMSYGTSAVREWLAKTLLFTVVATFTFLIPLLLDYLWPLWDERNRSLHDMMVSTLVVRA